MSSDYPDTQIDTMSLIQAVKAQPCLYARDNSKYTDVNYKTDAWEDITKSLFAEFWPKYNDEEKADKMDLVIKRWKNLRACFTREVKRQKEPKWIFGVSYKRRPYIYYNDLLFLKTEFDNADKDATASNGIDLPENNETDNNTVTVDTNIEEITIPDLKSKVETDITTSPTKSDITKAPPNTDNIKTSPNSDNIKTSPNSDNIKTSPNSDNIKTSPNSDNTGPSSNPDTTTNADPDSTHFALSLVPMLNMIPINERINAQINILSVLQRFLKRRRPGEDGNKKSLWGSRKRRLRLPQEIYETSNDDDEDFL